MKTFAALVAVAKASSNICPSNYDADVGADSGCYVQSAVWTPGTDVSCDMQNAACLTVTCGVGNIDAFLRHDLFQTNNYNTDEIMDQIANGDRKLYINNNLVDPDDEDCGLTMANGGIQVNWDYAKCNVSPTMDTNDEGKDVIVYSLAVKSPGNSGDSSDDIEFYVDTTVAASCEYDPVIDVDAEGFNVNQEDVEAAGGSIASLATLFNCQFFSDEARENELGESSIVNMGSLIFGSANSDADLGGYGLRFKLTRVTFCDESGNGDSCFRVVEGGHGADIISAAVQKPLFRGVGDTIPFRFNSFGFEDNSDQNLMSIQCRIRLEVDDGTRSILFEEPAPEGYGSTDY